MNAGFTFFLGLPVSRPNALWTRATALRTPVLISANAFSEWSNDKLDLRHCCGFDTRYLNLIATNPVAPQASLQPAFIAAFPGPQPIILISPLRHLGSGGPCKTGV